VPVAIRRLSGASEFALQVPVPRVPELDGARLHQCAAARRKPSSVGRKGDRRRISIEDERMFDRAGLCIEERDFSGDQALVFVAFCRQRDRAAVRRERDRAYRPLFEERPYADRYDCSADGGCKQDTGDQPAYYARGGCQPASDLCAAPAEHCTEHSDQSGNEPKTW